jgi:hypothetical protein
MKKENHPISIKLNGFLRNQTILPLRAGVQRLCFALCRLQCRLWQSCQLQCEQSTVEWLAVAHANWFLDVATWDLSRRGVLIGQS